MNLDRRGNKVATFLTQLNATTINHYEQIAKYAMTEAFRLYAMNEYNSADASARRANEFYNKAAAMK